MWLSVRDQRNQRERAFLAVEVRWKRADDGEARTMQMDEESDAAEIIGVVIGRVLPGAG